MAEQEYRPGDKVSRSGIFLVTHSGHRDSHEAVILGGGTFPACKVCGEHVRYCLVRNAAPLDGDSDFDRSAPGVPDDPE